jgi:hypothetical protein
LRVNAERKKYRKKEVDIKVSNTGKKLVSYKCEDPMQCPASFKHTYVTVPADPPHLIGR